MSSILFYWFSSQQSRTDVKNFDSFLTSKEPVLSVLHEDDTLNLENDFNKFTFVNEELENKLH